MNLGTSLIQRKQIVLLGIGHTNAYIVKQWATDSLANCELICISNFPTATYSGMLPGTLGWQFRDEQMRIDLRELAGRAGARLIVAETCGLDLGKGEIHFTDHEPISFDLLSIGVGSMPADWQKHVNSPSVVAIKPMQTFLARLNQRLQNSSLNASRALRVAVVGGGVASVEIAFCLQEQFYKGGIYRDAKIEIFTSNARVAEGMRARSVSRLERLLASRGIVVQAGHRVTDVSDTELVLDNGRRSSVDCVIWATGATAPPVLGALGLQTDDRGFIATSNTLQSLTDPRIFAVGDAGTVVLAPTPKAGVYAVRQCPVLWHNLRSQVNGTTMQAFEPQSDFLKLLNTGDGKALLEYGWFTAHARWCWSLKTWIDQRFVREFQSLALMKGQAMPNVLTEKYWSPYVVGAAIGVLSWFTFVTADHALGITTAFESTVALAEQNILPQISQTNSFFAKKNPRIDWGWMLVVGVFIGALISSRLSGDRGAATVPSLWAKRFGPSVSKRYAGAFIGGLLMLLGARLAGGCTSGHGISGSLQLAASSWLFVVVAFSVGVLTAFLVFGREGRSHG